MATCAINETRTYWLWDPLQQKFYDEITEYPRVELEEGEISEEPQFSPGPEEEEEEEQEQCSYCEGRGFLALGFDDVKDCDYCGGCGFVSGAEEEEEEEEEYQDPVPCTSCSGGLKWYPEYNNVCFCDVCGGCGLC